MTFIDAPQLKTLAIHFLDKSDSGCPRLAQFISCTSALRARDEAHVQFICNTAAIKLRYQTSTSSACDLLIDISHRAPEVLRLSSFAQVCNSSFHTISTVEDLYIERQYHYPHQGWCNYTIGNTLWLQLLRPFTAVKNLYLSKEFASGIAAALQELVRDRITELLPSLQNIFVEGLTPGLFQKNIGQFVATRQLSGHPIATSVWVKTTTSR